jgi:hypothetical protein
MAGADRHAWRASAALSTLFMTGSCAGIGFRETPLFEYGHYGGNSAAAGGRCRPERPRSGTPPAVKD